MIHVITGFVYLNIWSNFTIVSIDTAMFRDKIKSLLKFVAPDVS